jgi:chorismate-pyruvate lyase
MPALDHLASLFYSDLAELGTFEEVLAEAMPEPYRLLLAHHEHMTVSVEKFHGGPVSVEVLATRQDGDYYSRKIVLHRQSDGRVVLFGIPRINLRLMDDQVREEILSRRTPLGRVLIEHNVLREVQLASLYRVTPGAELCRLLQLPEPRTTYGRTAFIYVDGYPAIELLEIVTPEAGE